jgi:hypothetical protein
VDGALVGGGTSFPIVTAARASARAGVTMKSRTGGFSTGRIEAATNAASRLDRP